MKKEISVYDWERLSLSELMKVYDISIAEVYDAVIDQQLYEYKPPIERRLWKKEEKDLLIKYKDQISIREFSNIFHKSYYATLSQVKVMGLYEMIQRKNARKDINK